LSTVVQPVLTAEEFLASDQEKDLLRLVTAGSVDDGKSTLLGRLLYDSQSIYEDQLHAVMRASRGDLELALLTDGLRAEREQGITIDVAYRYFSTARRKFILADTPGHEQYTRNMATGASNADLAILLVDASRGIQSQSKRHAHIIGLLGIRHLVVLINKMDLVGYAEEVFQSLKRELLLALGQLAFESVEFIPVSANAGTNVVHRSSLTPWYSGMALLEYLESVDVSRSVRAEPFRFPVQLVQRTADFRGYSGQIAAGTIAIGDSLTVLPSRRHARVKSIVTFDGERTEAFAPQSLTLTVEDELDISRGDLLASGDLPEVTQSFRAQMIWFSEQPLGPGGRYLVKHTSQSTGAVLKVESKLNIQTLSSEPGTTLEMNDIGTVSVEADRALLFDFYRKSRNTGSFIVVDPNSNNTVAAGMITAAIEQTAQAVQSGKAHSRKGLLVIARQDEPLLNLLDNPMAEAKEIVVLSKWNRVAIDLLLETGMNVISLESPATLESSRYRFGTVEDLIQM
jgi:sulfate adenylyltransferase large subunit